MCVCGCVRVGCLCVCVCVCLCVCRTKGFFFIQSNIEFFFQLGCLIKVRSFLVLLTCAVMFSIKVILCMKVLKVIFKVKEKLELFVRVKVIFFLQNNIERFFSTLMLNGS